MVWIVGQGAASSDENGQCIFLPRCGYYSMKIEMLYEASR
jgi:hypothetical protein